VLKKKVMKAYGGMDVQLNKIITSALDEGERSLS
jgi:hypothetical protein